MKKESGPYVNRKIRVSVDVHKDTLVYGFENYICVYVYNMYVT